MTAPKVYSTGVKSAVAPLAGTERLFADNGSPQGEMITTAQLAAYGQQTVATNIAATTNAATSGTTLTAANITGATDEVDLSLTGSLGGAANAQLPTVASVLALLPNAVVGQSYKLRVINVSSGYTWTLTTNTGWGTLSGTVTIATATWRDFIISFTSITNATATITNVGGGNIV